MSNQSPLNGARAVKDPSHYGVIKMNKESLKFVAQSGPVTIEIKGPTASGKTLLSGFIADALREAGCFSVTIDEKADADVMVIKRI